MRREVVVVMRGKEIRLERIMNRNTKKTIIVPMDHGVSNGPIPGLIDMGQTVNLVADGGSMHGNIGAESEAKMLADLGAVSVECMEWGMPLLAMMYPRGKNIATSNDLEQVKLAARGAAELGADIVKTVYTGDPESFREVTRGCPVPVVVAGGSKTDDRTTLELIEGAMAGGAAGISIGRNAFQHRMPDPVARAAACIVHHGKGVDEAMEPLKGGTLIGKE